MNHMANVQERAYGKIVKHENGINYVYFHDELTIDVGTVKDLSEIVYSSNGDGLNKVLIVQGKGNDMTFESQKMFSELPKIEKIAYLSNSHLCEMAARHMMEMAHLFGATYQVNSFTSMADAEAWLLTQ